MQKCYLFKYQKEKSLTLLTLTSVQIYKKCWNWLTNLISFLYILFQDINYFHRLVNHLKRLTSIFLNIKIFTVLERAFLKKRSNIKQYDFEIGKFYIYAMSYFLNVPKKINNKNALEKSTIIVNLIITLETATFTG